MPRVAIIVVIIEQRVGIAYSNENDKHRDSILKQQYIADSGTIAKVPFVIHNSSSEYKDLRSSVAL